MIVSPIGAKSAETPFAKPTLKRGYDVYRRGGFHFATDGVIWLVIRLDEPYK